MYTDLIFDLYGTLVDIHTEENALVWNKTALYFGYYGAPCTGEELHAAFDAAMAQREAKAGQSYECFPDIPFEEGMAAELFGCQKELAVRGENGKLLINFGFINPDEMESKHVYVVNVTK